MPAGTWTQNTKQKTSKTTPPGSFWTTTKAVWYKFSQRNFVPMCGLVEKRGACATRSSTWAPCFKHFQELGSSKTWESFTPQKQQNVLLMTASLSHMSICLGQSHAGVAAILVEVRNFDAIFAPIFGRLLCQRPHEEANPRVVDQHSSCSMTAHLQNISRERNFLCSPRLELCINSYNSPVWNKSKISQSKVIRTYINLRKFHYIPHPSSLIVGCSSAQFPTNPQWGRHRKQEQDGAMTLYLQVTFFEDIPDWQHQLSSTLLKDFLYILVLVVRASQSHGGCLWKVTS